MNQVFTKEKVKHLSQGFNNGGIEWLILRPHPEFTADQERIADFDLLIRQSDREQADTILSRQGWQRDKSASFARDHIGYACQTDSAILSVDLQFDRPSWNEMALFSNDRFWNNLVRYQNWPVLSIPDYIAMLITHSILGKRRFKPEYQRQINELLPKVATGTVIESLAHCFGAIRADWVLSELKNGHYKNVEIKCHHFILIFLSRRPLRWITFARVAVQWVVWRWRRRTKKAPLVSIIGLDGTGKTTLTNNLVVRLTAEGRAVKLVYTGRGRNNILPIQMIGRPYKKLEAVADRKINTGNRSTLTKIIIYTMAAPVFALDLFLRYWFIIFPARCRMSLVITDRYSSDLLLMANVPAGLKKFLYGLFPRPTRTIYLYQSIDVLEQRRPDHPRHDLERQERIFQQILPRLKAAPVKSENEEQTLNECLNIVRGLM